jgi:hypothetical protein
MQLLRKIPFLIAWLVFYLSTQLILALFGLYIAPHLRDPLAQLSLEFNFVLSIVLVAIITLFTFIFSVRMIVFPLLQIEKLGTRKHSFKMSVSFLPRWIVYVIYYLLYSVPVAITGLFPANLEEPIHIAWRILASFLAFRGVVHSWAKEYTSQKHHENEEQVATT